MGVFVLIANISVEGESMVLSTDQRKRRLVFKLQFLSMVLTGTKYWSMEKKDWFSNYIICKEVYYESVTEIDRKDTMFQYMM